MSLATFFDRSGWNFQRLLAMVNLKFYFLIFLKFFLAIMLFKFFNIFNVFIEYTSTYTVFIFIFQRIFIIFLSLSCCPARICWNFWNIFIRFWATVQYIQAKIFFNIFQKFILNLSLKKYLGFLGQKYQIDSICFLLLKTEIQTLSLQKQSIIG